MSVLVLAELDGDSVADASLRALTLAMDLGQPVAAVVFPGGAELDGVGLPGPAAEQLAAYGAADIYVVDLLRYAPAAWARTLAGLSESGLSEPGLPDSGLPETGLSETGLSETGLSDTGLSDIGLSDTGLSDIGYSEIGISEFGSVTAVLAAATDRGSEVLAHLGAMTGLPVAANCVSVRPTGPGRWELVRQRWAGSLLEDAELEADLAVLSVAADAVPARAADQAAAGTVHLLRPEIPVEDLLVAATESAERGGGVSLATARVVVGGGRGVGGPDGFAPLEELASLLGGALGVSRVVTSEGWRPHRQQVGQTGTRISPELYLACGISGAIQHMAGCQSAKHIVAVNTDPDAPIISRADYAVIGDLSQVIPALVEALRART
jgi:electron transfer flavoprotein alpha subunit